MVIMSYIVESWNRTNSSIISNRKEKVMKLIRKIKARLPSNSKKGMEMVQVAILVAIAIVLGLIFKSEISAFVNKTFQALNGGF